MIHTNAYKLAMRSPKDLEELDLLIEYPTIDNIVMVEIGCYNGESTEQFLKNKKVKTLYAVDPWENYYDENDPASDWCPMAYVEGFFDSVTNEYKHKLIKKKMKSKMAVKDFEDESIDLIYIDGKHTYEAVKEDITLWLPKIKKGGFITGHDYGMSGHKVTEVVNEIFGKPDVLIGCNWMCKIRGINETY